MYKYSLDKCDVVDKTKAVSFREKREQWEFWFSGNDSHSIWNQISTLLWNHALFCTINELRKIAAQDSNAGIAFNSSVMDMFDAGYVTRQTLAIRRLTEKPQDDPNRAVISLRRILFDIRENLSLITRENYVAYDGFPYDPQPCYVSGWIASSGDKAWLTSKLLHDNFDRLSGVASSTRNRNDLINGRWINYLDGKLKICDDIKTYVDKFVAHGSDPETRSGLSDDQLTITLDRLEKCYQAICQVAAFIYGPFLWIASVRALPTPQYNHLEHLDKPWINSDQVDKVHDLWWEQVKIIEQWQHTSLWPAGDKLPD
jgi:hypothetical protein